MIESGKAGAHAPSAARRPPPSACRACEGLRTGIEVTTDDAGTVTAAIHVGGSLCDDTAAALASEIDDLLDLGVSEVTIHLESLTICAADGWDALDRGRQQLEHRFGATRLDD